jgi:arylsulfatase A-like enzyme
MVVLDTVRADRLSVYGYERDTTPNLRKFAGDSVVYRHAIAASDMTLASHASLFTGMYPSWHGAHCDPPDSTYGRELDPQARTLAEILSHNGYSTFGVSSNMYLRADFGLQRGFGAFRIPRPVPILTSEQWYLLRRPMRSAIAWFADTSEFYRLFARSEDATRELLAQASRSTAGAPFFAFVNYMDAHFPYVPPAPFDGLFPGKDRRTAAEDLEASGKLVLAGGSFPDSQQRHVSSQYDGAIAYMDAQVGRILDWLRDSDLYDNTMIVVTSDHGEQFGEKNLVLHGNSAYQELLHVPLIIRYPRGERTGEVDETVSLVDVVPTILDSLGYEVPPQVQGRSLLDSGPRIIYAESFPCPVVHSPKCPGGCTTRAALSGPHKLILSSNGSTEFYDVVKDPAEKWNLLGKQAPDEQRLGAELAGWLKTRPPREKQSNQVDQETLRRLKSLGYVQ